MSSGVSPSLPGDGHRRAVAPPCPRALRARRGAGPACRYGLIIDDKTSSSLNFRVEPGCERTAWWGGVAAYDQMRNFPWAELRVIARGSDARPNPLSGE